MTKTTLCYRIVPAASVLTLAPEAFKATAQSPSSIGGRTLDMSISQGNYPPFATSGSFRFLPAAEGNGYVIVPVSGSVVPSNGTYSYTKTGPDTANLSLLDGVVESLTAICAFSTPVSGTYRLTSGAFPGASQSGTFALSAGASPATIAGANIQVDITGGTSPLANYGSYQFLPALSGNAYTITALSCSVVNSSGVYSYVQDSGFTGSISFTDSVAGSGLSLQLSFASTTNGSVYLSQVPDGGYQTGLFSMQFPVPATERPVFSAPQWNLSSGFGSVSIVNRTLCTACSGRVIQGSGRISQTSYRTRPL